METGIAIVIFVIFAIAALLTHNEINNERGKWQR